MKKYIIIIPVLFLVYFMTLDNKNTNIEYDTSENYVKEENESISEEKIVRVSYNEEITDMQIDEYVIGVLACEMPALFHEEALKAGAVAIRTFYFYKAMDSNYIAKKSDQCYISKEMMQEKWKDGFDKYYSFIEKAVNDTKNEIVTYNGEVIESFYFSLSNGYTENSADVFGGFRPYLVSVSSSWDKELSNYLDEVTFSLEEFYNKLNIDYSEDLTISDVEKSLGNRIISLSINGTNFKGTTIRNILGLRSTDFDIEFNQNNVVITTRGFGHGVGMSQYGANEMAKLGYSYKDILTYYYKGTEISKI